MSSDDRCVRDGDPAWRRDDSGDPLCRAHFDAWAAERMERMSRQIREMNRLLAAGVRTVRDQYGRRRRVGRD